MRLFPAAALALIALPVFGADERPLTPDEFDAYATGKTLAYALSGEIWGYEQYLPGKKVVWAFEGDECQHGEWYAKDDQVCFTYEHDPTPQCWRFFQGASGLRAEFVDDPDGTEMSEVSQQSGPLPCPGPDVGV